MSKTRLASSFVLTCAALAVALSGCSSDQTQGADGVGNVGMEVTLATPPSGPNEQIDTVDVSFYCDGIDPVLGVPRPPQSSPETFTINTSTSQGPEPKNTIGLFEKQGLPAGKCHFSFAAASNTGNTECTGELSVMVNTNETTEGTVILACIHTPRYGGVRPDGTFNQCAEYRQVLVTPTTQAIGNLVDVRTEVYDPDGDLVTVAVQTTGACGNVQSTNGTTAASCTTVSGCQAVVNTVECTDVGPCQIIVAVSDDGFDSCTGFLPNGSNNNAARSTIAVDCTVAQGCGNEQLEPGEDCDPPDGVFCDDNCQDIDNCSPDPCNQGNVCSPEACTADPNDNSAICTADPGSAAGNACSPPAGGTCDGQGSCVACTQNSQCEDNNACTDNACVAGACVFTPDDSNTCSTGGLPGTCNAGTCEGLCTGVTCTNTVECVTNVCDPADGQCKPQNDGINTGCDLGGSPGVCDGQGTCVECNIDAQCASGETCVNNVCEAVVIACLYEQDFEALVKGDPPQAQPTSLATDGWKVGANVFAPNGTTFLYNYFAFPAPNGGPAFSAVAVGEGGASQGAQQFSVYNDYNNTDHAAGNIIEAIVFRERTIVAGDVGTTIVFTFDAKKGNILVPPTTAAAFIKTIAVSNTTNALFVDTTNLPATWDTFTISLPIIQDLVGQILQIGFQSRATNYNGSGIFYDNITLGPEGCGGGGGPSGELTTNGDFETGTLDGWTLFCGGPNAGSCSATAAQKNGGVYSGNLVASVPAGGGPPSFPLMKQANIGIGTVQPNSTATISFDLFGSLSGAGGVFFAEFFSELSGGGTSSSVILGGAPLFPNGTWTTYTFNTPTGNDVSGGVTLQLKADCGANPGCTVDAYIDNVSVTSP
jgi:hypothetical protein